MIRVVAVFISAYVVGSGLEIDPKLLTPGVPADPNDKDVQDAFAYLVNKTETYTLRYLFRYLFIAKICETPVILNVTEKDLYGKVYSFWFKINVEPKCDPEYIEPEDCDSYWFRHEPHVLRDPQDITCNATVWYRKKRERYGRKYLITRFPPTCSKPLCEKKRTFR